MSWKNLFDEFGETVYYFSTVVAITFWVPAFCHDNNNKNQQ